jgi:hypothetical protein
MIRLGVLLRAHRREHTLRIVLRELRRYATFPGISLMTVASLDRPTPAVSRVLSEFPEVATFRSKVPLVSGGTERWMEAENEHLDVLEREGEFDWLYLADDDRWFDPTRIGNALGAALQFGGADAYVVESLFFHTYTNTYTTTRKHRTILLWRHAPGVRCTPGSRVLNCPEPLHEQYLFADRIRDFPVPLLDYGSFHDEDRAALASQFAGVVTAVSDVATIQAAPSLVIYPTPFLDLYKDYGPQLRSLA